MFLQLELLKRFWYQVIFFYYYYPVTSLLFTEIAQFGTGATLKLFLRNESKAVSVQRHMTSLPALHVLKPHILPIKTLPSLLAMRLYNRKRAVVIQSAHVCVRGNHRELSIYLGISIAPCLLP